MPTPMNPNGTVNFDRVFNLYKGVEARPVHNQKEYDAAIADGYGEYSLQPYPYIVYNENGVSRKVNSAEEEEAAKEEGFQRGRLHVKKAEPVAAMAPKAFVPHNDFNGAIQALERRTDEQSNTIGTLLEEIGSLKALLESLTAPPKRGRPPKNDD